MVPFLKTGFIDLCWFKLPVPVSRVVAAKFESGIKIQCHPINFEKIVSIYLFNTSSF